MTYKLLLTESQAGEMIGFKVSTMRKRRWQGLPPQYLKVGSKVFYDERVLQEFLDSCVRNSTSDKGDNNHMLVVRKFRLTDL